MPRSVPREEIKRLPKNARTVTQYAKDRGCDQSLIYKELVRGKANFKIVIFQGINFVIPN